MSDWFERYGYAKVADGLWTGAVLYDAGDVATIAGEGITAVFNLCEDAEYEPGERAEVEAALAARGIAEERLPCIDFGNLLPGALEQAVRQLVAWLDAGEQVYLHCRAGWQRSATVAIAVVAVREGIEIDEARGRVKQNKPSAEPLHHQLEDLWRWWRAREARSG